MRLHGLDLGRRESLEGLTITVRPVMLYAFDPATGSLFPLDGRTMELSRFVASGRQARSVRSIVKDVSDRSDSAVSVHEEHVRRLEEVNPELNAIVTPLRDRAAKKAAWADATLREGTRSLPLAGVPFSVKDIIVVEGVRATAGSLLLSDYVARQTAPVVERLEAAGACLMGKSNCSEFALEMHTTNRVFGNTKNPWNVKLTSGGSSGGDSAAVASGCVAFGIGTDFSGSIRWPAHCTGLASLRPTPGLVPATGQLPFSHVEDMAGLEATDLVQPPNSASLQAHLQLICPIARYVDDLWTILKVMAGQHLSNERTAPVLLGEPSKVDLRTLRVTWRDGDGTIPVVPEVVAVVEAAAVALSREGIAVGSQQPPGLPDMVRIFNELRAADGLPDHESLADEHRELLTERMRKRLQAQEPASVAEYRKLSAQRDLMRSAALSFMNTWHLLLLPIASIPPFEPDPEYFPIKGVKVHRQRIVASSAIGSFLGLPCLAVPFGQTSAGIPIGVQLVGRPFCEHELIAVGRILERYATHNWSEQ